MARMTQEQYEQFSKARLSRRYPDDDLFGCDSEEYNMEDRYYWSVYGQCWLPK